MANIYTISSPGTAFAPNKCMLGIFNGVGSGKVIRIYRVWTMNAQTLAVTGLNNIIGLWRITTGSGGFAVPVSKHDSTIETLPSAIVCATGLDYVQDQLRVYRFHRFLWSSDEPAATTVACIDEIQTQPNAGIVLDYSPSYYNTAIEPPTIREGFGFAIVLEGAYSAAVAAVPVGSADFFIEFTAENS